MKNFVGLIFGILILVNGFLFTFQSQDWVADTPADMQGIAKLIAGIGALVAVSLLGIFMVLIFKDDD